MNCNKCQEYILTDYLDDELGAGLKQDVDAHLSSCQACREFALLARKAVVDPFNGLKRAAVDEPVWNNIKEEITRLKAKKNFDRLSRLKNYLFPKPAFVLTAFGCLLLMLAVFSRVNEQIRAAKTISPPSHEAYYSEQIDYVAYLMEDNDMPEEFGTSIEEYFL